MSNFDRVRYYNTLHTVLKEKVTRKGGPVNWRPICQELNMNKNVGTMLHRLGLIISPKRGVYKLNVKSSYINGTQIDTIIETMEKYDLTFNSTQDSGNIDRAKRELIEKGIIRELKAGGSKGVIVSQLPKIGKTKPESVLSLDFEAKVAEESQTTPIVLTTPKPLNCKYDLPPALEGYYVFKARNFEELQPYMENRDITLPNNVRKIAKIKTSILKRGRQFDLIRIDANFIINDGHLRIEALRQLWEANDHNPKYLPECLLAPGYSPEELYEKNKFNPQWTGDDHSSSRAKKGSAFDQTFMLHRRQYDMGIDQTRQLLKRCQIATNGEFTNETAELSHYLAQRITALYEIIPQIRTVRLFISALIPIMFHPRFDYDRLVSQLKKYFADFKPQRRKRESGEHIQWLYNRGFSANKKETILLPL